MSKKNVCIIVVSICVLSVEAIISGQFSERDYELISALGKFFGAGSCVFLSDSHQQFDVAKNFFKIGLLSTVTTLDYFETKMSSSEVVLENFHYKKILIVRKGMEGIDRLLKVQNLSRYIWIIFLEDSYDDSDLKSTVIPIDCHLLLIRSDNSNIQIDEIYDVKEERRVVQKFGTMTVNGTMHLPYNKTYRRNNFHGVPLTLGLVSEKICRNLEGLDVFQKVRCFHQDIFSLMANRLNFTKEVVKCGDKANPYVYPNGSFSGLFKMLLDREVDASSGSFVVSANRLSLFDFIWPTFTLKTVMYVRRGKVQNYWTSYLRPFDLFIWYGILSTIFLTAVALFVIRFMGYRHLNAVRKHEVNLINSLLTVIQIFCNQGLLNLPQLDSFKVIYAVLLLVAVILFPAYSGSIASSLTVHVGTTPFTNLDGFFEDGRYKLTAINGSFIPFYFKYDYVPKKPVPKNFMLDMNRLPKDTKEGVDGICERNFAYVGLIEDVVALQNMKCSIIQIPTPIFYQYLAIGTPKNSTHAEHLKRELIYLRSVGIISRMKSSFVNRRGNSLGRSKTGKFSSVSFQEIISGVVCLVIGFAIALCILVVEGQWNRKFRRRSSV